MSISYPPILYMAFASGPGEGTTNIIPYTSAVPAASWPTGWTAINATAVASGGVPPSLGDFNGVFNALSSTLVYVNAGGQFYFDSTLAGAQNYPLGSTLVKADRSVHFQALQATALTPETSANVDDVNWCCLEGRELLSVSSVTTSALVGQSFPPTTVLYKGMQFAFTMVTNTNSGAFTINVGTGAVALVRNDGNALVAGDLAIGTTYAVIYDGTQFKLKSFVASQVVTPSGSVMMFAGSVVPSGWLLCDGSAVSQSTYRNLFLALGSGSIYGTTGSNFYLPNMQGNFPIGAKVAYPLGTPGGSATALLNHTHFVFNSDSVISSGGTAPDPLTNTTYPVYWMTPGGGPHSESYAIQGSSTTPTLGITSGPSGSPSANSLPPYLPMNFIIKT